jgi:DNA-binding CsgD family transcriptional regulator
MKPVHELLAPPQADIASALRLSPRERQVAHFLAEGYSNVNIAALCGVSTNTARTLIQRIYRKLGVCNRADLVREMLRF